MESPKFSTLVVASFLISITCAVVAFFSGSLFFFYWSGYAMTSVAILIFLFVTIQPSQKPGKLVLSLAIIALLAFLLLQGVSALTLLPVAACVFTVARCYFLHSSLKVYACDLALSGFSILFYYFALTQSDSVFLCYWSFFLSQSICILITHSVNQNDHELATPDSKSKFLTAMSQAEYAIRQATR